MPDDIDFKKMADQEPEFRRYASDALYEVIAHYQPDFIKAIYSFYSIGMTSKQVSEWIATNMRLQGGKDAD